MSCCRRARSPSPTPKDAYHRSQSLSPSRKARAKSPSPRIVNSNAKGTLSFVCLSTCLNVELALRRLVSNYRIRFCYAETRAGSPIPDSNPLARSSTVARRPPVNSKHLVCPEHSFDLLCHLILFMFDHRIQFLQCILCRDKLPCSYTLTGTTTRNRRKAQAKAGVSSSRCSQGAGGGTMSHCTVTWMSIDYWNAENKEVWC